MAVDRERRWDGSHSLSVIAQESVLQLLNARRVALVFDTARPSEPLTALDLGGEELQPLGQSSCLKIPGGSWSASLVYYSASGCRSPCPSAGSSH